MCDSNTYIDIHTYCYAHTCYFQPDLLFHLKYLNECQCTSAFSVNIYYMAIPKFIK